ncbi:thiamine biosynthesis protein ThiF [Tersicoccus phoenicis]|uniref:Thiamine biosynthesis protein ThiF n=1 Tax=Tersicoccus phoenicis TaxID=554083 RepID=A0A1R1LPP7_9MICC|nr:ThiF family adenylyltransferase [Tersicoccus phoenicis]OMH29561.1 thiamine biosynthesis protein ThiF [Tersicoccus phoenicis]
MSRRNRATLSAWQKYLVDELRLLARERPQDVRIVQQPQLDTDGDATLRLRLRTADIPHHAGGLELGDDEQFIVRIRPSMFMPPSAEVDHTRFVGFPHVPQGQRLCIYLDPSREWRPSSGMAGFLSRLWDWLTDAAAGAFDPSTAMYHAVGGVLHQADGTPTIVVREPGPLKRQQIARLITRSPHRYDLTYSTDRDGHRTPVFVLASDLPFGAASTFALFLTLLDDPNLDRADRRSPEVSPQSPAFLTSLLASALRNPDGTEQYFVLAVPHPTSGPHHLLGGRLPATTADALRRLAKKYGTAVNLDPAIINSDIPIEWCNMSDERQEVTIRRDDNRPVNGFQGKTVHVWGCGGLGSWLAEFIARAGASAITVCDPGTVTGGLLVRQNYTEADIGQTKADALATRLRAIRDDLTVTVAEGNVPDPGVSLAADLIIDATVSHSIATYLDTLAGEERTALIAQVATDARTGSLGIANICAPGTTCAPSELDDQAGRSVVADGGLELYHRLWEDAAEGDELIPTRGCSVPTFHGSAADLAAVAATLVNMIGLHLQQAEAPVSGTHLIALPHAPAGPRHHFLPAASDTPG